MDLVSHDETKPVTLAIATVPVQPWEEPYSPEDGLKHGTIFPSLNMPFYIGLGGEYNG